MAAPEGHAQLKRHLVWLRADLRAVDNTALAAACADNTAQVACVYALTPEQWRRHDVAGIRVDFELRTLAVLQEDLAARGIPLLVIDAPDYGALPDRLARLAGDHGISAVFANRQYEVNEQRRDDAVSARLADAGIALRLFHDQCILPPGSVLKQDGSPYAVFTPFKRLWQARIAATGITVVPAPRRRAGSFATGSPLPAQVPGFTSQVDPDISRRWWPPGEHEAQRRLSVFCAGALAAYAEDRDFPARAGVSRLSPYLAIGAISARQCLNAALNRQGPGGSGKGGESWISELAWRDFYKHVMAAWPRVCMHRAFQPETDAIPWRHDEKDFRRWCEGRTGFPIVDAAMRQLQETGWMHNRLRMVTAMFLTKDLLIDWRWGERFFMQHLIDGDLAANNGGWQWSASTGNDAAPYFRIFNPVAQSRKFDPGGDFIRRYVPELRDLPGEDIHEPHAGGQASLFTGYPPPMVDHALARERVLKAFKAVRSAP